MKKKEIIEILENEMVERKKELRRDGHRTDEDFTKFLETDRWLNRLRVLKNPELKTPNIPTTKEVVK